MEPDRFDHLAQRLARTRLTRLGALRGLAASAAALTGVAAFADGGDAGRRRRRRKKSRNICHCQNATANCETQKVSRTERKRHFREDPCDYKGKCRGTGSMNPCDGAGAPVTVNINLLGQSCVAGTDCGNGTGLECVLGFCVPIDLGDSCNSHDDCSSGRCTNSQCDSCPGIDICGSGNDAQCCLVEADCISDVCVGPVPD